MGEARAKRGGARAFISLMNRRRQVQNTMSAIIIKGMLANSAYFTHSVVRFRALVTFRCPLSCVLI